jgi:large subunit ribosomal protein L29
MPVGTPATEYRSLETDELTGKLNQAKQDQFTHRFQAATGQLENHGRLQAVRKDIARIYTVLRERELGITEVEAPEGAA